MGNKIVVRGLVFGIVLLFIGASFISVTSQHCQQDPLMIRSDHMYTYYYTENGDNVWDGHPERFVDGDPESRASTSKNEQVHDVVAHNGTEELLGIVKVELRVRGFISDIQGNYYKIYPVFDGSVVGDEYNITDDMRGFTVRWSSWIDITFDSHAPEPWTWQDVVDLDVRVIPTIIHTDYCAIGCMIELRCTEGPCVYIDDDFNESTPGWQITHFDAIQDGIDAVEDGGIVFVYNGLYAGDITICDTGSKTVNVIGESRSETIIDAAVSSQGDVGFHILEDCPDCYIKKVCCRGFNSEYWWSSGILVDGDNAVITDCNLENNRNGLLSADGTASNGVFYHNNLYDNTVDAFDENSNIWYSSDYGEGNYYEDYEGEDADGDRIGDTPYDIPGGDSQDLYPLMFKWTEIPPVANFSYEINVEHATFDASSSYDRDGYIASYLWDFGDGTQGEGLHAEHSYEEEDEYEVTLMITDNDGYDAEKQVTIFIDLPDPSVHCEGSLHWTQVTAGSTVTGSFILSNNGDPGTELDWAVYEYPSWGSWTFNPVSGNDLTPEDGLIVIQVEVIAPNQQREEFTGEIKVVNIHDTGDYCTIDVSLATPVSQQTSYPFLQWLLDRFPHSFPILRFLLH